MFLSIKTFHSPAYNTGHCFTHPAKLMPSWRGSISKWPKALVRDHLTLDGPQNAVSAAFHILDGILSAPKGQTFPILLSFSSGQVGIL